jgi:hypothetical protein
MPVGTRPPWVKISQCGSAVAFIDSLGVDGDDDALVAELVGGFGDKFRALNRGGVNRHLVGAGQQQFADILDGAHAAADGQRHEALFGGAATTS